MDKEVDAFLEELSAGQEVDPFKPATDPFADTKIESKEDESGAESDEDKATKPEPFHKDPKVQRYVEKEITKALKNFKPEVSETQKFIKETSGDDDEMVSALTDLIGNDTPEKVRALKAMSKAFEKAEERGAQKALQQIEAKTTAQKQEENEAREVLTQGFESIEEEFDVDLTSNSPTATKNRTDFIQFIQRIAPKDANGEVTEFPDFSETFKIFQETKRPDKTSVNRAKELSAKSMGRSGGDGQQQAPKESSWKAVDKFFSKLTS